VIYTNGVVLSLVYNPDFGFAAFALKLFELSRRKKTT
jgi:hypothetical protein